MNRSKARQAQQACAGFTLLELVVVMGILSGFLLMLVQMLSSGVSIFQEGERGQNMADRRAAATRAVSAALDAMIGPTLGEYDPREPDLRLLLSWAPLGLQAGGAGKGSLIQVLRASVSLTERDEAALLAEMLRVEAEDIAGGAGVEAVQEKLADLLADAPRAGRGEMLLLPWPVADDGVFLELRQALLLPDDDLELMKLEDLGGEELPAEELLAMTEVLVGGLLHFEIKCWSQRSRSWEREPGSGGPEYVWDSARAGMFLESENPRERFNLDLGPESLLDPRDDIYPRWCRVTMVLDDPNASQAEAILIEALSPTADAAVVDGGDLMRSDGPGMVKIGAEWVGYRELRGSSLLGLQRGLRNTVAVNHATGARLRRGVQVVIDRPLHHGRDAEDV